MMQIKCEMCGSSNMVKEDSLYVCKHCGMKYSPEEAKKMMVEIEGAVKIDDTEELSNLYVLARRARDNKDTDGILKYYGDILRKDPMSWEASLFLLVYDHTERVLAETEQSCQKFLNGISSIVDLVKDTVEDDEERKNAYSEVSRYTVWATENILSVTQKYEDIFKERRSQILTYLHNITYTFANQMQNNFPKGEYADSIILCAKQGVKLQSLKMNAYVPLNNEAERKTYLEWVRYIKQYDPRYWAPSIPGVTSQQIESGHTIEEIEEENLLQEVKELEENEKAEKKASVLGCVVVLILLILAFFFVKWAFGWILGDIGKWFGL